MSHHNTILGQMLKMFSRHEFQKAVSQTGTEYHSRGFSSWNHFVAMLFGQLAGVDSLRGIEAGLATQSKYLYHLGVKPIARSTLAYANEHRSHELFKKMFEWMLSQCQPIALIYKDRWQIELFFKAIKQLLKVKSFVGTSQNALLSQLWVALIAYLLLAYLKFKSKFSWSLYTLCSILPTNIFSKRNLWDWLNDPFHKPKSNSNFQYQLAFG